MTGALFSVSSRLDTAEAARISGPVAHTLAAALERATDSHSRDSLASALFSVSACLGKDEAARICGPAARMLAAALRAGDGFLCPIFVGVGFVFGIASAGHRRGHPGRAGAVAALERETDSSVQGSLASALSSESPRLEKAENVKIAQALAAALGRVDKFRGF